MKTDRVRIPGRVLEKRRPYRLPLPFMLRVWYTGWDGITCM